MTENKGYRYIYCDDGTEMIEKDGNYFTDMEDVTYELNAQENKLNQIKKLCKDNKLPLTLTAFIPNENNCEHYHTCYKNNMTNAQSYGASKIAKEILKIINGDVE